MPQWMQANTNGAQSPFRPTLSPAKPMQQDELQVESLTMPTSIDCYLCGSPAAHHTLPPQYGNRPLWKWEYAAAAAPVSVKGTYWLRGSCSTTRLARHTKFSSPCFRSTGEARKTTLQSLSQPTSRCPRTHTLVPAHCSCRDLSWCRHFGTSIATPLASSLLSTPRRTNR